MRWRKGGWRTINGGGVGEIVRWWWWWWWWLTFFPQRGKKRGRARHSVRIQSREGRMTGDRDGIE